MNFLFDNSLKLIKVNNSIHQTHKESPLMPNAINSKPSACLHEDYRKEKTITIQEQGFKKKKTWQSSEKEYPGVLRGPTT